MLYDPGITGDKGVQTFPHHISVQPGEIMRQCPEQLLKPEIANEDAHKRQDKETPLAECNRGSSNAFISFHSRTRSLLLLRRGYGAHKSSHSHSCHDDKVMFLLINTKGWLVFYSFIGQRSHAENKPVKSARRGIDREKNTPFDRDILRNVMGRSKNGVDHEKLRRFEERACFPARDDFFLC